MVDRPTPTGALASVEGPRGPVVPEAQRGESESEMLMRLLDFTARDAQTRLYKFWNYTPRVRHRRRERVRFCKPLHCRHTTPRLRDRGSASYARGGEIRV